MTDYYPGLHGIQTPANGLHGPFTWVEADATAREAIEDFHEAHTDGQCLCFQEDDGSIWRLESYAWDIPTSRYIGTWVCVFGGTSSTPLIYYNDSGGTINAGDLCYVTSYDDTEGLYCIAKAIDPNQFATVIAIETVADSNTIQGSSGYNLTGLNTAAYDIGQKVYLDHLTAGNWTVTPQWRYTQIVGFVTNVDATDGHIHLEVKDYPFFEEFRVYNNSGSSIAQDSLLQITGFDSGEGLYTVDLAQATAGNCPAVLVAKETIADSSAGQAVREITYDLEDTSAYNQNDVLYLSDSVAGAWTDTPPSDYVQAVGYIRVADASVGRYKIQLKDYPVRAFSTAPAHNLLSTEHSDTTAATPPKDGSLIRGNSGKWEELDMSVTPGEVVKVNAGGTQVEWGNLDDRYYTETELDAGQLDDRYYTETEVDSLIQGLDWQESVLEFYDPSGGLPAGPSTGDRYIASATANGWTEDYIYEYNGASWAEIIPDDYAACYDADTESLYVYNESGNWVIFGSTNNHEALSGLQGGTTNQHYHLTSARHTEITDFFDNTDITGGEAETLSDGSNADSLHTHSASHAPVTLHSDLNSNLLDLSTQELDLDTQQANKIFAGPSSGGDAKPTFRALVDADIPSAIARDSELHIRDHAIDSTADHDGVSGATEDNFMSFNANNLPQDSGYAAADFAEASHQHAHNFLEHSDAYGSGDEAAWEIPVYQNSGLIVPNSATSSSDFDVHVAARAIDEDDNTFWAGNDAGGDDTLTLAIASTTVTGIKVLMAYQVDDNAISKIEYYDGTWHDVSNPSETLPWTCPSTDWHEITFDSQSGVTQLRVTFTRNVSYPGQVWEIRAIGTGGSGWTAGTITAFTAETAVADDDEILIYDTSASAHRKMTRANFITLETANTLYVDGTNGNDSNNGKRYTPYATIAAAIAAASTNDTIVIMPGTYTENLDIDTELQLVGAHGYIDRGVSHAGFSPTVKVSGRHTIGGDLVGAAYIEFYDNSLTTAVITLDTADASLVLLQCNINSLYAIEFTNTDTRCQLEHCNIVGEIYDTGSGVAHLRANYSRFTNDITLDHASSTAKLAGCYSYSSLSITATSLDGCWFVEDSTSGYISARLGQYVAPVNDEDLAPKKYVDDGISALNSFWLKNPSTPSRTDNNTFTVTDNTASQNFYIPGRIIGFEISSTWYYAVVESYSSGTIEIIGDSYTSAVDVYGLVTGAKDIILISNADDTDGTLSAFGTPVPEAGKILMVSGGVTGTVSSTGYVKLWKDTDPAEDDVANMTALSTGSGHAIGTDELIDPSDALQNNTVTLGDFLWLEVDDANGTEIATVAVKFLPKVLRLKLEG